MIKITRSQTINHTLSQLLQRSRRAKYRVLSDCERVHGRAKIVQPVLFSGSGTILLKENVQFGWPASTGFYSGYSYVEARYPESAIEFSDNVVFNNCATIISEGAGIYIGSGSIFGPHLEIFDSDFHALDPGNRTTGVPSTAKVNVGNNVFVGSRVTILKGATVGDNSVIGSGSIVTSSIPAGVIAAGNPAQIVREL